jgi:putative ABC transport system permease protein
VNLRDLLGLTIEALRAHRMRYGLSALAIAVGVAAVVLMSSIGEGMRRFIMTQMSTFGSSLIAINPGKTETGGMPGIMGGSARRLTLDDARALARIPGVAGVVPTGYGSAIVEYGGRGRRVYVYGVNDEVPEVWSWRVASGENIPKMDWDRSSAVTMLGAKLKRELFGDANPLGKVVRIGEARFRVIGVMEEKGQFLGFDLDDSAFIPVANAMRLFNLPELNEIDLLAASNDAIDPVAKKAEEILRERHRGQEDVTIVTQKEAQATVNNILEIIGAVVTGIAAISLLVGAIGILTIMWIVVQERVREIGLVKALGARGSQIITWYLFEAAVTAFAGGIMGLLAGMGGAAVLGAIVPGLEVFTPPEMVIAACVMAVGVGLAAGVGPAIRAARLDPVEALRGE